jgi:uncharacterized membrane protein YidH (DUF202 family)
MPGSGRRRIEFALDALLLVLLLFLFAPRLTGLPLHEWLGIAFVPPIVVHLLLSWRWVATSTRRLGEASTRSRVNYFLNALLFVLLTLVIASGVAISEVAVPTLGIRTIDDRAWRALHNLTLNWLMLIAGFHIAINWNWVRRSFRAIRLRKPFPLRPPRIASVVPAVGQVLVIVIVSSIIVGAAVAVLGVPSATRRYAMNEIARFAGSPGHGWFQLSGKTLLLFGAVYLGRKGLRLRL